MRVALRRVSRAPSEHRGVLSDPRASSEARQIDSSQVDGYDEGDASDKSLGDQAGALQACRCALTAHRASSQLQVCIKTVILRGN